MSSGIQIILLDLGGVLLQLRDPGETFGLNMEHPDFLEKWLLSPAVRRFESGNTSVNQFAQAIIDEFSLVQSPAEFIRRFESWPDRLYAGVPGLLATLCGDHHLAILSNTNAIHWNRDDIAGQLNPVMDKVFLSYQTGNLKPEPQAFEEVVRYFGAEARHILFLDDNPLNIDAAKQCGMRGMLTRGFEGLVHNLSRAGIILQSAAKR